MLLNRNTMRYCLVVVSLMLSCNLVVSNGPTILSPSCNRSRSHRALVLFVEVTRLRADLEFPIEGETSTFLCKITKNEEKWIPLLDFLFDQTLDPPWRGHSGLLSFELHWKVMLPVIIYAISVCSIGVWNIKFVLLHCYSDCLMCNFYFRHFIWSYISCSFCLLIYL